ncbi:hypothetical protein OAL59_01855 [Nitrosopumilus sp.]|nr:hypothetical protein [Nitrosopumilus sp.]
MKQTYEWTPEILKKARENCIWRANQDQIGRNISKDSSKWIGIANYKVAVNDLCETHPDFPRKKYERKKLAFTDKEYLKLRNAAKKKNLSSEIIQEFDNYFYLVFRYAYRSATGHTDGTLSGFGFDANILRYLKLAYYIHWVKVDNADNAENDFLTNPSHCWNWDLRERILINNLSTGLQDNELTRLGICKEEKSLE